MNRTFKRIFKGVDSVRFPRHVYVLFFAWLSIAYASEWLGWRAGEPLALVLLALTYVSWGWANRRSMFFWSCVALVVAAAALTSVVARVL